MESEGSGEMTIRLDGLRDDNLMQLKELSTAVFPISYPDSYYAHAMSSGEFTRLAYYNDICIGSIACKLEKKEGDSLRVYIMMLGVLAPYRRLGIGTRLVNHVLDLSAKHNITQVYLHARTDDNDVIAFYMKLGFEITDTIDYRAKNIDAPDCHIMSKPISPPPPKN